MNRRLIALTLASLICCVLLFTIYPSIKLSDNIIVQTESKRNNNNSHQSTFNTAASDDKNTFVTIISDLDMVEPTLVTLYSLNAAFIKNPKSKVDVMVVIPKHLNLDSTKIHQFEKLNANVIPHSTTFSDAIINLWTLFEYQKVVYFTPNILFDNNVDHLFTFSAGSAIKSDDEGSNTSLFILEPNVDMFESLLSDYRKMPSKFTVFELLDDQYFTFQKRIPQYLLKNVLVFFDKAIKPWNFHYYQDNDWRKQYDPVAFYKWKKFQSDVRQLFNPNTDWENISRHHTVCDDYISSVDTINQFPIKDQFSVLLSTYNPERIEHLSLVIKHFLKSDKVHIVYITWHNPNLQVPDSLFSAVNETDYPRIKVLNQRYDSLNNRFNPIHDLKTEAVYILDDDIFIEMVDLEFTFEIWKNRKDSVVGHFPRLHSYDKETQEATYLVSGKAPTSIVLTKSMFIRSDYLFSYTCLLEPKLHEYVDKNLNCEDIGFMMMVSGMSGVGSTYVKTQKFLDDFGLDSGISANNVQHMPARAQCVADFITQFWAGDDPLVFSYETIGRYSRPTVRTGNWYRVRNKVLND